VRRLIDPSRRLSRRRLLAVARKEALQLRRDPRSLMLAFLMPVVLMLLFGYAITWDVDDVPTAVLDQDGSSHSRALLDALGASGDFRIVAHLARPADADAMLLGGGAQLVVVVPAGFGADLGGGRTAALQALVDGSDANTATIVLARTQAAVQDWSRRTVGSTSGPAARRPLLVAESRVWYNEELRSRNMIVPGLVAVIMMIIAAMLTSLTLAREWERGTLEQLAATPVTRFEIIAGKLLPYLAIGLVDVAVCTGLGIVLFDVPMRGSPWLFLVLSFFFLIGALGLGIFVSAVARTQLLATQMALVLTFLPAYLLSGFMFAIEVMPRPLQLLTAIVPARYFLVVTRGIFLKGVGIEVLRAPGLMMILFAAIGLLLALRIFRKQLP
jgi:ABC-2 type transport system permease protein